MLESSSQHPLVALTSGLLGIIFSKGFVSGNVRVQEHQWVFRDVINLQEEKVPDDFMEGDLGEVDFGEGLDGVDLWLPYKHNRETVLVNGEKPVYKPANLDKFLRVLPPPSTQ